MPQPKHAPEQLEQIARSAIGGLLNITQMAEANMPAEAIKDMAGLYALIAADALNLELTETQIARLSDESMKLLADSQR